MKEKSIFEKNVSEPSIPPDEVAQIVSKKLSDELFFFSPKVQNLAVSFNCVHVSKFDFSGRENHFRNIFGAALLMEIGFCGNSLGLIMGDMCWDCIEQRGTWHETDGGYWWYGPWILWHLRRCC